MKPDTMERSGRGRALSHLRGPAPPIRPDERLAKRKSEPKFVPGPPLGYWTVQFAVLGRGCHSSIGAEVRISATVGVVPVALRDATSNYLGPTGPVSRASDSASLRLVALWRAYSGHFRFQCG
jgi:hypothetical protein